MLGTLAAYALARFAFFGRSAVSFLIILPIALPGIVTGIALNSAFNATGVSLGYLTVIVGHAYPYFTLVGGQYLNEGEADVVQPRGTDFEVLARLGLRQWRDLATLPVRQ